MQNGRLHPEHLEDLRKSGLSDEVIAQHGIYSVCPSEIKRILGYDPPELKSLLAFPYPGNTFVRYKLFPPIKRKDGHYIRYFQPEGSGLHIYFPPGFDPNAQVIRITEGEKKTLKGTQEGLNVCGLGGIWNFAIKDGNGRPRLIDDFQQLNFKTVKRIEIIPDGDLRYKKEILHAVYRLASLLGTELYHEKCYESISEALECINVVELPSYIKLDDFLVKYGVKAFEGLPRIAVSDKIFEEVREKEGGHISLESSLIDLKTLLKMDIPERLRLFPWLPQGGLAMVYGPRGIGKTYFSLSLTVSLATGTSFLRWPPPPATGVLFIDGEMPIADLRDRLVALIPDSPQQPINFLSGEQVYAKIGKDLNLANSDFQKAVLNILDYSPQLKVVIIDNISSLFMGLRENVKDDWERVMPWLLALRRRGVATLLVHHSGKSGDQRGTSAREDFLDAVLKLETVIGGEADGARFVVHFTKCRGAYGKDIEAFEVHLDLNNSKEPWTWKPFEDSTYDRMLKLARDGVRGVTAMAEALGVDKAYVSRLKKRGIAQGLLAKNRLIIPIDEEGASDDR